MAKGKQTGIKSSGQVVDVLDKSEGCRTADGAGIGELAKAALSDFVHGKAAIGSTREITRLLGVMVKARHLELTETRQNGNSYYC